jgi:hypothetical protein
LKLGSQEEAEKKAQKLKDDLQEHITSENIFEIKDWTLVILDLILFMFRRINYETLENF